MYIFMKYRITEMFGGVKVIVKPITSRIYVLSHEFEAEPRTSVNNKDILRVWWGLTGFYPSALIYHVFYPNYVLNAS